MTGPELRKHREGLSLTQAELAARLGVASITLSRWERGVQRIPAAVALLLYRYNAEMLRRETAPETAPPLLAHDEREPNAN